MFTFCSSHWAKRSLISEQKASKKRSLKLELLPEVRLQSLDSKLWAISLKEHHRIFVVELEKLGEISGSLKKNKSSAASYNL